MKNKRSDKDTKDESLDRDGWLLVNKSTDLQEEEDGEEESYACGGMARAAFCSWVKLVQPYFNFTTKDST